MQQVFTAETCPGDSVWHHEAVEAILEPIQLHTPESMEMDDEKLFEFCQVNRGFRVERNSQGDLLIRHPRTAASRAGIARLCSCLGQRSDANGMGRTLLVVGYFLPNGAMRSPDVSWVSKKRLQAIAQKDWNRFLPVCPDFVLEH